MAEREYSGCTSSTRQFPRRLTYLWREPTLGLEPSPIVVDETDKGDGTPANLGCEFSDFVVGDFGRGIENLVPAPMSRHGAILNLGGPLADQDHIEDIKPG